MTSRAAVLIVDMQRDFLTQTGFFKKPVAVEPLRAPLSILLDAARDAAHPVVWITSAYPDRAQRPAPLRPPRPEGERFAAAPMNNDMLASGHAGRPCCAPGSDGAQLHPDIAALVRDPDWHLTKTRYSSFGDTDLAQRLRDAGVSHVYICGVVTNVCVRATAADAFFSGFDVTVVSDCVGATRMSEHRDALVQIARLYGDVAPHTAALTRWRSVRRDLGAGDTEVRYGVLPDALDADAFAAVRDEIDWQQMRHRGGLVPRLVCLQGAIAPDGAIPFYRHPADEQPPLLPWSPFVDRLRAAIEAQTGQLINHALIQRYMDGSNYISPHADKTLDIARGTAILGLSLGATRSINLRAKLPGPDGSYASQTLELPHGSLFVLGWRTNQEWSHGIRQDNRQDEERREDERRDGGQRISLTMRTVATFLTPDGLLYGQGARRKARDLPPASTPHPPQEEAQQMLSAFALENQQADFDWELHYGQGFDALDLNILNAPEAP
jgi:nicotinamidase-related amidase/alkylated DNA repair dioxygenase AlkB